MELEKSTRSIGRKVCFAHSAYHMQDKFEERRTGIASFQVRSIDELKEHLSEVDVVVISMMWKNELLKHAPNLKYIQSISSGTDHFDRGALRERGIRLASASKVAMARGVVRSSCIASVNCARVSSAQCFLLFA